MRKNLILLLIIVLLAGIIYYFKYQQEDSTLPESARFAVKNIDRVHQIFLADMQGNNVKLIRKNDHWMVNDRYPARQDAMKHLLQTIKNVEVKAPVPKNSHERIKKNLASNHIKVELYDASGEQIKTFFVGGSTNQDKGTYMMLKGSGEPYVTHLPGFKGYLTPRFFTDSTEWRSRIIMRYRPEEIQQVKVDYPGHPKRSYRIKNVQGDSFQVTPLHRPPITDKSVFHQGVKKYLTFFRKVGIENYLIDHPKEDSVRSQTPFAILTVIDQQERQNQVKAYPMPKTRRSKQQFTPTGEPTKYDPDRMFGVVNNGADFAVIQVCPQVCIFGKLFRSYEDFFVDPSQAPSEQMQ
jgi:hypothetical protein